MMDRYIVTILPEHKHRQSEIRAVLVGSLLEQTASLSPNGLAIYRTETEQVKRLDEFWTEWKHVFSEAGKSVSVPPIQNEAHLTFCLA